MLSKDQLLFLLLATLVFCCLNFFRSYPESPAATSTIPSTTLPYSSASDTTFSFSHQTSGKSPLKNKESIGFAPVRRGSRPLSECSSENLNGTMEGNSSYPTIAILAASTSRTVLRPSTKSLALFQYLLPSLVTTLDCGFRYVFILGYDEGDMFFDTALGMNSALKWFHNRIETQMRQRNIILTLKTVKVINHSMKPGPVFLAMGREAYNFGAEYFYRVNDDSFLQGNWPSFFVRQLNTLPPPYGVIGPSSLQTENRILTHDFVHKTHLEIFRKDYYPAPLSDWWMDDWISRVYCPKRSFITGPESGIDVLHYVHKHGKRYHVDYKHEKALHNLTLKGHEMVLEWMLENGRPETELNEYRRSCASYGAKNKNGDSTALFTIAK